MVFLLCNSNTKNKLFLGRCIEYLTMVIRSGPLRIVANSIIMKSNLHEEGAILTFRDYQITNPNSPFL